MDKLIEYFVVTPLHTYILFLGTVVAIYTLRNNRVIAKKQATINFVQHELDNADLIAAKQTVIKLATKDALLQYSKKKNGSSDERAAIMRLLSHYEFMAVGVHSGALDEGLLQKMKHSTTVQTYSRLKPFILKLRASTGVDTIFQDFEALATRFDAKPLKVLEKKK